ncbi:hypothetical protein Fmac_020631 [Flemingia macrophylla]|uniref:Nitric oxide synthase-interacting protein zinc-finger domain-containing protein n=1 Tax=Flemingia macrophylla TaxID=520843 RepID=A0ABD1LUK4_9FABA
MARSLQPPSLFQQRREFRGQKARCLTEASQRKTAESPPPQRHSKNNNDLAFFKHDEKQKLGYGTQKERLDKDSIKPFDVCCLCLTSLIDPKSCHKCHIFCKECILQCLLSQKKDIQSWPLYTSIFISKMSTLMSRMWCLDRRNAWVKPYRCSVTTRFTCSMAASFLLWTTSSCIFSNTARVFSLSAARASKSLLISSSWPTTLFLDASDSARATSNLLTSSAAF